MTGGLRLVGVRCSSCFRTSYPVSTTCPLCGSGEVIEGDLPPRGIVTARTSAGDVHVAEAVLEDGVRVLGRLEDATILPGATVLVERDPDGSHPRFLADA